MHQALRNRIGPPRTSSGTTGGVISKNWYSICSLKTFSTGRHFYYTPELLLWNPAEIYDSHKAAAAALSNASTQLGCDLFALESRMSLCLQLFQLTTSPSQVQTAAHRETETQVSGCSLKEIPDRRSCSFQTHLGHTYFEGDAQNPDLFETGKAYDQSLAYKESTVTMIWLSWLCFVFLLFYFYKLSS